MPSHILRTTVQSKIVSTASQEMNCQIDYSVHGTEATNLYKEVAQLSAITLQ